MNRHFNLGRETAHFILFLISLAFSVQLFWYLGNSLLLSIVFSALATSFELEKWYASKKVKADWQNKKHSSFVAYTLILVILIILSITASYAAVRTSIMSQTSSVTVSIDSSELEGATPESLAYELNEIDTSIQDINDSTTGIKIEKEKMADEEGLYIKATADFEKMLAVNKAEKEELLQTRAELVAKIEALKKLEGVGNEIASEKIFKTIADDFGTTDTFVLKIIMLTLILILEMSLFLVTEPLKEELVVKKDEKEIFTEYVNSMFLPNGKYLRNDNQISKDTGIDLRQCKKYRELISAIKMRGNRFPIEKEANGWVSSMTASAVINMGLKNLFAEGE